MYGRVARTLEVNQIFNQLFSFSKILVVILGPVSVDELGSVENAPFALFRSAPGFR